MDVNLIAHKSLTKIVGGNLARAQRWMGPWPRSYDENLFFSNNKPCFCDDNSLQKMVDIYKRNKDATLRHLINRCLPNPVNGGGIVGISDHP